MMKLIVSVRLDEGWKTLASREIMVDDLASGRVTQELCGLSSAIGASVIGCIRAIAVEMGEKAAIASEDAEIVEP